MTFRIGKNKRIQNKRFIYSIKHICMLNKKKIICILTQQIHNDIIMSLIKLTMGLLLTCTGSQVADWPSPSQSAKCTLVHTRRSHRYETHLCKGSVRLTFSIQHLGDVQELLRHLEGGVQVADGVILYTGPTREELEVQQRGPVCVQAPLFLPSYMGLPLSC